MVLSGGGGAGGRVGGSHCHSGGSEALLVIEFECGSSVGMVAGAKMSEVFARGGG